MYGGIVASNYIMNYIAGLLLNMLNTGSTIHLFTNSFIVTPATPIAAFTEATFPGYAPVALDPSWPANVQVQPGEYQTTSPLATWTNTSVSTSQTIQGFWIDDVGNWYFASLLNAPFTIGPGQSFALQVAVQGWALAIVPT